MNLDPVLFQKNATINANIVRSIQSRHDRGNQNKALYVFQREILAFVNANLAYVIPA